MEIKTGREKSYVGRLKFRVEKNAKKGIFLGFAPRTTRNILWYNPLTSKVSISKHARFDEGFSDLPLELLPPNAIHLNKAGGAPYPAEEQETTKL